MILKLVRVVLALAAFAAFSSCATLNEKECRTIDWRLLGVQDGADGRPQSHIERHREACGDHKLPVQQEPWLNGWQEGIRRYCTPLNGLRVGAAGEGYANSCPAPIAGEFETAYLVGQRVHQARSSLESLRASIGERMRRRQEAKTDPERMAIEREIMMLRSDQFAAENRVFDAERAYDRHLAMVGR